MFRVSACVAVLAVCGLVALAQDGIQKGKIKNVDVQGGVLTVGTGGGKDVELNVIDATRFMGADGTALTDGLMNKAFKEGVAVMFKARNEGGKLLLIGVKLAAPGGGDQPFVKVDTSRLKPITEMGSEGYQGFKGGLYPDGKNERPLAHEKAGLALAHKVQPLDANGKPSPDGKIVLLSVGMSNTTQVFSTFKRLADADQAKNPRLILVDGAQGGMTAFRIQDPEGKEGGRQFWATVDQRLAAAGATRAQVQAIWIKQADAGPKDGFPKYARTLQEELATIVRLFPQRFPNARLVYLSSRTHGGYAKTRLNPEPYAFESGLSVRWLIEEQLKGDSSLNYDASKGSVAAPWLSWGPYLWANGSLKRADGFFYEETDFGPDGTHPSKSGQQKVANLLLSFFKNDTTTRSWFVR